MRRLTFWLGLGVLAAALAMGAAAAVPQQHTSPVTATLIAPRVTVNEQTCAGDDGQYSQALETYAGVVLGDPRLTGVAAVYLASLTNTTTGNGTTQGALLVTDPSSHQIKVQAVLQGVATGSGGSNVQGLISGTVHDLGSQLGGRLVANFTATRTATLLNLAIGSGSTNAHPAVIQGGHCAIAPAARFGK